MLSPVRLNAVRYSDTASLVPGILGAHPPVPYDSLEKEVSGRASTLVANPLHTKPSSLNPPKTRNLKGIDLAGKSWTCLPGLRPEEG